MNKLNFVLIFLLISVSFISCSKENTDKSNDRSETTQSPDKKTLQSETILPDTSKLSKAVFAAGCFWCEETLFESIIGVGEVVSGYAGGNTDDPAYEEVGSGKTGHAESFLVYYDSTVISYNNLLRVYFSSLDPTQVNGQGPDLGTQYRSIIFYTNENEKSLAEKYISDLSKSGKYDRPISVEVKELIKFYPAEKYHQDYIVKNPDNPYVTHESIPRIKRSQKQIPELVKPGKNISD